MRLRRRTSMKGDVQQAGLSAQVPSCGRRRVPKGMRVRTSRVLGHRPCSSGVDVPGRGCIDFAGGPDGR